MYLCKECNSRFSNFFEEGQCQLCKGNVEKFLHKAESSLPVIKEQIEKSFEKPKYFSLSTSIPKEYLIKEEEAFDFSVGESIKSSLNAKLKHMVEKQFNLQYTNSDSDIKISFAFPTAEFSVSSEPLYIFGIYKKLKGNISQKRWDKYENSVEALIGEPALKFFGGTEYFLHASGREDADATNLGGRPFVLEIKNPNKSFLQKNVKKLELLITNESVEVELLGRVPSSFVVLVSDSHFDKSYRAYLSFENCDFPEQEILEKLDFACKELSGKIIYQQTPLRVVHRRADKIRKRKCYTAFAGKDAEGIYMGFFAEAGTYIKELINGDEGRTKPNVSESMQCRAKCSRLIVKNINYEYLMEMFGYVSI